MQSKISSPTEREMHYLDVEGSTLDLRRALLDDKWDAIWAVLCCLGEVDPKQVKPSLQLFVATLDSECL